MRVLRLSNRDLHFGSSGTISRDPPCLLSSALPPAVCPVPHRTLNLIFRGTPYARRHASAGHRRAGPRRLPENRSARIPRPLHARSAAHRHRHHRQQRRSRIRHAGRNARRAGSHPRHQALQTGQPRHQARQHGHQVSQFARHHRRPRPRHHRRTLRHREPRPGLHHRRARRPRRSPVLPRRRLQASHFSLFFSGTRAKKA